MDTILLLLTAMGLTTGEVQAHMADVYGADVSPDTISKTERIVKELTEWKNRLLDRVYPVLFIRCFRWARSWTAR